MDNRSRSKTVWVSFMFVATVSLSDTLAIVGPSEMQCAPRGTSVQYLTSDQFYPEEVVKWAQFTKHRYLEGDCTDVAVSGYEGYPTKRCRYKSADAGTKQYPALHAEVILLDPSAEQLASWNIHACRTNGATDAQMAKCLKELRQYVVGMNSAQFPVAGSVVESYCNSSPEYADGCRHLPGGDKGRQPRNTWFRNGVSIDYSDDYQTHWDSTAYPSEKFDDVFDVEKSDKHISKTLRYARISGATRQQWKDWRKHIGNRRPVSARVAERPYVQVAAGAGG